MVSEVLSNTFSVQVETLGAAAGKTSITRLPERQKYSKCHIDPRDIRDNVHSVLEFLTLDINTFKTFGISQLDFL